MKVVRRDSCLRLFVSSLLVLFSAGTSALSLAGPVDQSCDTDQVSGTEIGNGHRIINNILGNYRFETDGSLIFELHGDSTELSRAVAEGTQKATRILIRVIKNARADFIDSEWAKATWGLLSGYLHERPSRSDGESKIEFAYPRPDKGDVLLITVDGQDKAANQQVLSGLSNIESY